MLGGGRPTRALWKANSDLVKKLISPPLKMTAWCIIWLHAVQVLDRDNLSNPTGDLIVLTRATLSSFWLCACQGFSRQDPKGKKVPLFDPDIEPLFKAPSSPISHPFSLRKARLVSLLCNYEWMGEWNKGIYSICRQIYWRHCGLV